VVDLRAELGESALAERAAIRALTLLSERPKVNGDDGAEALAREVMRDLQGVARDDLPLRDEIAKALRAFAETGAREAYARARDALEVARGSLDSLEAVTPEEDGAEGRAGSIARRTSFAVLRDLDLSLLERDVLGHLLSLGGNEAARSVADAVDPLHDRLAAWILAREETPLSAGQDGAARLAHPTLHLRRLRALLHLVDSDMGDGEGEPHRAARLRKRGLRIVRALLDRFEHGPPSPVRRTLAAALARALHALVRVGGCDPVDALLVAVRRVDDPVELYALAEASMHPDLVHVVSSYARFAEAARGDAAGALAAFEELASEVAVDTSGRAEALRTVLVRLGGALSAVASAPSLRALAAPGNAEPEPLASLEGALASLVQLAVGARGRFDPERAPVPPPAGGQHPLMVAVARVLSGASPSLGEHVLAASLDDLLAGVPKAIAAVVKAVVWRLAELPVEGGGAHASSSSLRLNDSLPAWLPARRTIGGFYVLRSLSAGALGSVFVVTRVEDKGDADAEKLALKVPEYSASAARQLSEAEFLQMFRQEASALIALPQHANLARFVTFDAGSKPKPILVMELVEGVTLERLLETRNLDTARALRALEDVLRGLEAVHAVGVGHLDVKPSNVVLRRGEEAVLVDFGLAGRRVRPGCATGPYGAPEVWLAGEAPRDPSPAGADMYAFGCVAYETLTGETLFGGDTEMAQIAQHLSHDGSPPPVRALARRPALMPLAELLFATLRRDPQELLARVPWPIEPR
jgi:hypothetical protein